MNFSSNDTGVNAQKGYSAPTMDNGTAGLNLNDSVFERLLRERIIFLGTEVNDDIANRLCAQILLLSAEDLSLIHI